MSSSKDEKEPGRPRRAHIDHSELDGSTKVVHDEALAILAKMAKLADYASRFGVPLDGMPCAPAALGLVLSASAVIAGISSSEKRLMLLLAEYMRNEIEDYNGGTDEWPQFVGTEGH